MAACKITLGDLPKIIARRGSGETWQDIAPDYGYRVGCNLAAAVKLLQGSRVARGSVMDPIEAERVRLEAARRVAAERAALQDVAGERSMRSLLEVLVKGAAKRFAAPPPYKASAHKKEAVGETIVQCLSDWHAYEEVLKERTRNFNEYNSEVLGKRVRKIVDAHLSIKNRMERGDGWYFKRLILGLNGDFISGTIHELERHSDAPSVVHAVYGCGLLLAQAIRDLAGVYPVVDLFCTSGNHGRFPDARRVQQKDPWRNWDTLIYLFAREHLRELKNLNWFIPNSYSVAWEAEGYRFLQTHGHDVKSWNSIPHYGINRMVSNLNALEASRMTPINYFLFGHFHDKSSLQHAAGEAFINGSLIGGTEFGINALGKSDRPCQWMLGVHKEHGVSWRFPLATGDISGTKGYDVQPWQTISTELP